MILFYYPDQEVLDLSGVGSRISIVAALDILEIELRLLVLFMPLEEIVVIPPTYYFESHLCRRLLARNAHFLEKGFLGFLMDESTFVEFRELKRSRYEHVHHIDKYRQAYYADRDFGLSQLPPTMCHPKGFSVGTASFEKWTSYLRERVRHAGLNKQAFGELIKRLADCRETQAFLWEAVEVVLDKVRIDKGTAHGQCKNAYDTKLFRGPYRTRNSDSWGVACLPRSYGRRSART